MYRGARVLPRQPIWYLHARSTRGPFHSHAFVIQQAAAQRYAWRQMLQQAANFVRRQAHRQALTLYRLPEVRRPGKVNVQNFPIENQQRRERLIVGGGRYAGPTRQVGEVSLGLRRAHHRRMLNTVPANEVPHPAHIGIRGAQCVVEVAHLLPQLIKQPHRSQRRFLFTARRCWALCWKHVTEYKIIALSAKRILLCEAHLP